MPTVRSARGAGTSGKVGAFAPFRFATRVLDKSPRAERGGKFNALEP